MPTFKLFGAAMLAAMIVTPALAQAVIQEPGYCAFFYPNANCQNKGPGNPYTDPNWRRDGGGGWGAGRWSNGETPLAMAPKRPPRRRSSPSPER
jgi:hypothetical protein